MMLLSSKEKEVLQKCGNLQQFNKVEFEKILECVNQKFNFQEKCLETECSESHLDAPFEAVVICLLSTVFAKESLNYSSFYSTMYELDWNDDRIARLWDVFEIRRNRIRWNLGSCTTFPPQIVDIKWKLDYVLKNSGVSKSGSLFYIITLCVQHSHEKKQSTLTFSCSLAQLNHLLTQLRQATRCIKNYSSKFIT